MNYIKDETSIETLNKILYKYVELHAGGMITTDELSDILVHIIKRKIQLAEITTFRELLIYINRVYSMHMNGEITDTEYETTNVVIDDMISKAFK